jgi:beta-glucosidase
VVQVYISDDEASVERPKRELKAFSKVRAEAGAEVTITLDLPPRAFMFCDVDKGCWRREAGSFTLSLGFSATDIRATLPLVFAMGATEAY